MDEKTKKEIKKIKMSNSLRENNENEGKSYNSNINYSTYLKKNSFDNGVISTNNVTENHDLKPDSYLGINEDKSNNEMNNKFSLNGNKKANKNKSSKCKNDINSNIIHNSYFESNSLMNNTIIPGNLNNFNIINSYLSYDTNHHANPNANPNFNIDMNNPNTGFHFNNFNNKENNTMNFNGGYNYSMNNDSMFKTNLFGGLSNEFFLNQHSINMYNLFDKTVNNDNVITNSNVKNNNYTKSNTINNFNPINNHNLSNVNSMFSINDENKRQQFQNLNLINIMNHIHPPYSNFPIKNLNEIFIDPNSNSNINLVNQNFNSHNNLISRNKNDEKNKIEQLKSNYNNYSNINFNFDDSDKNNSNNVYIRKKQEKLKLNISNDKSLIQKDQNLFISKNLSHDYKSKKEIDKNLNTNIDIIDDEFIDFNKRFYNEDYMHADIVKENLLKSNYSIDDAINGNENYLNIPKNSNELLSKKLTKYSLINNDIMKIAKRANSNFELNNNISLKERDSNETEHLSENHSTSENCINLKDQNCLPIANIKRIIKNTFNDKNECKLSQEAVKNLLEILNEFIAFVISEAFNQMKSEKKQNSKKECRKTLNGCHLIKALSNLGFESYAYVLESYFSKMDHDQRGNRNNAFIENENKIKTDENSTLKNIKYIKKKKPFRKLKINNSNDELNMQKNKYYEKNNTISSNNTVLTKSVNDDTFHDDIYKLKDNSGEISNIKNKEFVEKSFYHDNNLSPYFNSNGKLTGKKKKNC